MALLTVDLEDYRRQELRDHLRPFEPPHPSEVEWQLDRLLGVLDGCGAGATFFTVGRLARELAPTVWGEMAGRHRIGCHGLEHLRVEVLGRRRFAEELRDAKAALENVAGAAVQSFRSPYFSGESCDPWFGEALAAAGFLRDSSRRLRSAPAGFAGTLPLAGSGGQVLEVPLPSLGFGPKRITIIGGTYLRMLPLSLIIRLLEWGSTRGFYPMIYLHPYDLDPEAAPLGYHPWRNGRHYLGDRVRRAGRQTAVSKLQALARIYDLVPLESACAATRDQSAVPVNRPVPSCRIDEISPHESGRPGLVGEPIPRVGPAADRARCGRSLEPPPREALL